jgi:hypothetical protein
MDKEQILILLNSDKIEKINEAYEILKSDINQPLLDGNSFLHILAIRGKNELLDFIKKLDEKIYSKGNDRCENILHLAFKNGYDDLGLKLLKFDKELIEFQNNSYHYPTIYTIERINTFEKVIDILLENGFTDQLNAIDDDKSNLIIEIILHMSKNLNGETKKVNGETKKVNGDINRYLKIIKKITKNIDFEQPTADTILNITILNRNFVLAEYFIKKNLGINFYNKKGLTPLNALISVSVDEVNGETKKVNGETNGDVYDVIKLLLSRPKFDLKQLDRGGTKNEFIPLNQLFNLLIGYPKLKDKIESIILLLLKYIKNFDVIDNFRNTYGIYLAEIVYLKKINIDKKIQDMIFNNSDPEYMNIDGYSINSIKKNQAVDKCKILKDVTNIEFPEIKRKVNHVIFNTDVIHNMLYFTYLIKKYSNLKIPQYCINNKVNGEINDKVNGVTNDKVNGETNNKVNGVTNDKVNGEINDKVNGVNGETNNKVNGEINEINKSITDLTNIVNYYFCELAPSLILWYNESINFIHPKLNKCIKKLIINNDCRYIAIKISIIKNANILHANIILFDKNDLSYRRFEPYGTSVVNDIDVLDKQILTMIYKELKSTEKQIKIKCYRPQDYLELTRFQSISNDNHVDNKITGDPFGFCLAWCIWYIEIKVKNPTLSEKELIQKASDKIFVTYCDSYSPYNDFIRDYAAMLDEEKNSLLKTFGVDFMEYYKKTFSDRQIKLISEGIKTYL